MCHSDIKVNKQQPPQRNPLMDKHFNALMTLVTGLANDETPWESSRGKFAEFKVAARNVLTAIDYERKLSQHYYNNSSKVNPDARSIVNE